MHRCRREDQSCQHQHSRILQADTTQVNNAILWKREAYICALDPELRLALLVTWKRYILSGSGIHEMTALDSDCVNGTHKRHQSSSKSHQTSDGKQHPQRDSQTTVTNQKNKSQSTKVLDQQSRQSERRCV